MKFFGASKKESSSKKHSHSSSLDDRDPAQRHHYSEPSSPTKSSSSSSSRSPKKSSRHDSSRDTKSASRQSRLSRQSTDPGASSSSSSRRGSKYDPDTHPLNLPPEERKRFSTLSRSSTAMSANDAMDIDREPVNGASGSPKPSAQANFSVPIPNGTMHGEPPAPPPHKSAPSSPAPSTVDEAEAFKAAGNKFFKEKDYRKAIEQYSNGKNDKLHRYKPDHN